MAEWSVTGPPAPSSFQGLVTALINELDGLISR
jgi:hypothetical protein